METKTIEETLAQWSPLMELNARNTANSRIDQFCFRIGARFIRRSVACLAELYADYLLGTDAGRSIVSQALEDCGLLRNETERADCEIGAAAGKLAFCQAQADIDLVFLDNCHFARRMLEGVDPDDLKIAIRYA